MRIRTVVRLLLVAALWPALAVAQTPPPAGTIEYYHVDALGSVRAVTDVSGAVVRTHHYHPFGEVVGVEGSTDPLRFTGKPRDAETGLDYFGARYYAGRTGRFTTVDPLLALSEATADPQLFNRYSYVTNNPVRYMDPDGRERAQILMDISARQLLRGEISREQYAERVAPRELTPVAIALTGALVAGGAATLPGVSLESLGASAFVAGTRLAHFDVSRSGHIFRDAPGHINPATDASRQRFSALFEQVASDPANLRKDAVQAGLITKEAAKAGVRAYTWTASSGQQIWVTVRDGVIQNAGVNGQGGRK